MLDSVLPLTVSFQGRLFLFPFLLRKSHEVVISPQCFLTFDCLRPYLGTWRPFLESPGNLPGLISIFLNVFSPIRQRLQTYMCGTWPMLLHNYKTLKFSIQSEQKLTSVKKHLSTKTLIGPGKLAGLSRNGPQRGGKL